MGPNNFTKKLIKNRSVSRRSFQPSPAPSDRQVQLVMDAETRKRLRQYRPENNDLLNFILKSKEHLMIDVTGRGTGAADSLEARGIKIDRVMPEPGSRRSLFRVCSNGL